MIFTYLGFLLIGSAVAQVPFIGGCPNVETMEDFQVESYLGKWYEQERYFAFFQFAGKCVTATYNLNDNGTVSVYNRQISSLSGTESGIQGYAIARTPNKAKLGVVFPSLPVQFEAPYWILDTDYTSYALVYSCNDYAGIFSLRNVWILTRDQIPAVSVLEKAYQAIDKNHISKAFLSRTDQKNCPSSEASQTNQTESNQVS